ncbi:zinc-binding dehydrogenase [Candidatus Bathyarchaeota archaeon]|nr:zinc-binding dehydrogenase [Candidatus Bathyarchaeota archaeon]MBS7629641.1 zinc-binding dehydrogenase [Candidatus Bathyarchaeota archaeon]
MSNKELSIVLESPRRVVPRYFDIPTVGSEGMLLKVEAVSICGSDAERYTGVKFGGPLSSPLPIIMGHEVVGTVHQIGEVASKHYGVDRGDRVVVEPYILCGRCRYCLTGYYQLCVNVRCYGINISCEEPPHLWGAYGQYMYVAPNSRVHKISTSVPKEEACLASTIGNAVRWVCIKGDVKPGETVAVLGPGPQGLATVMVAHHAGAGKIILAGTSIDRRRLQLGIEYGADHTVNVDERGLIEAVSDFTSGEMADKVICTTGSVKAISEAVRLLKPLGVCVIPGLTGGRSVPILTDEIVTKELRIIGGLGQPWNVEAAIKLLESRKYPVGKMATHILSLDEADKGLRLAAQEVEGEDPIKVVLTP